MPPAARVGPWYTCVTFPPPAPGTSVSQSLLPSASMTVRWYVDVEGYRAHWNVGGAATASIPSAPGPTIWIASVTLNADSADAVPPETVTYWIEVPPSDVSGSRTMPSFSKPASTAYSPSGTP